jgi:hypothetical protein
MILPHSSLFVKKIEAIFDITRKRLLKKCVVSLFGVVTLTVKLHVYALVWRE